METTIEVLQNLPKIHYDAMERLLILTHAMLAQQTKKDINKLHPSKYKIIAPSNIFINERINEVRHSNYDICIMPFHSINNNEMMETIKGHFDKLLVIRVDSSPGIKHTSSKMYKKILELSKSMETYFSVTTAVKDHNYFTSKEHYENVMRVIGKEEY